MNKLYYTPPSDKIFKEVQEACKKIWEEISEVDPYEREKLNRINFGNIGDNFMTLVAMFDSANQRRLLARVSPEAKEEVRSRAESVGHNF